MIVFPHDNFGKNKDGASYISDNAIEDFVELLIKDYKPDLLETPQTVDWSHFLEFYLERNFQMARITPFSFGEDILGTCSFDDLVPLSVTNPETGKAESLQLNTGDIVLNSMLEEQPQRLLFTALHKGGHWVLHKPYYFAQNPAKGQMRMFGDEQKVIKCCRKSDIESRRRLETTEDHLEHQANVFAAAFAMPRKAVLKVIPKILRTHKYEYRNPQETDIDLDRLCKESEIESEVAALFGVSKQVAKIRLEQLKVWYKKNDLLSLFEKKSDGIDWSILNEAMP